jgi:predicted nucleic acid-binding protein
MKQTKDNFFIDSNILLYLTDDTSPKNAKAKELIATKPVVSVQIIFECLNVCLKKLKLSKETSINFALYLFRTCEVVGEKKETGIFAIELFSRFSLQGYDAKIIATALDANCSILYSEDMQNGLVIDNRLQIVNPFL